MGAPSRLEHALSMTLHRKTLHTTEFHSIINSRNNVFILSRGRIVHFLVLTVYSSFRIFEGFRKQFCCM